LSFEIKEFSTENQLSILILTGGLNHSSYEQLKKQLKKDFEASKFKLILDFSAVTTLSSIVIGSLFTHQQLLKSHNGNMILCACSNNIMAVFRALSLGDSFTIVGSLDEAKTLISNQ